MYRLAPIAGLLAVLAACDPGAGVHHAVTTLPAPGAAPTGEVLSVDVFSDGCVIVDTDGAGLVRLGYANPAPQGWADAFAFVDLAPSADDAWIGDLPEEADGAFFVVTDTSTAPATWTDPGTWFVLPAAP